MPREAFPIGGYRVRPGHSRDLQLPLTKLVTGGEVTLPVRVLHGREPGPVVWLDAAIHGDEVVGTQIIHGVLGKLDPKAMRGTVIVVPVVNVLGFMTGDRYLPDRRDLNRVFPGSRRGSLASRIAHLLMSEVVSKCSVGIDLHSGSDRRSNLPQIRADLDDPATRDLALAFGAPVAFHAKLRDGSLRSAAREAGATVLLYEAGEAHRLDDWAVEAGVAGVLRVFTVLGLIAEQAIPPAGATRECRASGWVRARRTGILYLDVDLGAVVQQGQRLGTLVDSFGTTLRAVYADRDGIVIGRTFAPVVHRGDALVHIAQ